RSGEERVPRDRCRKQSTITSNNFILAVRERNVVDETQERECPFCKETIKAAALKCRFCGSRLGSPTLPDHKGICPFCKEEIKPGAVKCYHCHSYLGKLAEVRARAVRRRSSMQGCGCGGNERGISPRLVAAARAMRAVSPSVPVPQSDYDRCVEYCFLLTLGS